MIRLFFCTLALLFYISVLHSQNEVDSLINLVEFGDFSEDEKRRIGLRINEIYAEENRKPEDRYLERATPFVRAIPYHLDTLMRIALDDQGYPGFRERSIDLIAASQSKEAYSFLIDNLTEIVIMPIVIPGEEPYFRMRYCFHVLYQIPDRKHLLPLIFSNISTKQRSDEYCRFIAILLNKENKELIKGWGQVYSTTTESLFFAENWQKVCSHLTP